MKIKKKWIEEGKIDLEAYTSLYNKSINNNDDFWSNEGDRIYWYKKDKSQWYWHATTNNNNSR